MGARNFLVLNAPDIGNTPESRLVLNNESAATAATLVYNSTLQGYITNFRSFLSRSNFYYVDTYTLFEQLYADALNGGPLFGFTNAAIPCFPGFAGSTGANCATSLFADDIHPTTGVHALLAQAAYNTVHPPALFSARFAEPAVENPEPSTLGLCLSGLACLTWNRRRCACDPPPTPILLHVPLGQWDPTETIRNYVGMLQKWQGRCYHRGELMEKTDANYVFDTTFKEAALRAGIQHQLRFIRRPLDSVNKEKRIRGLAPRFRDGRFFVNSTVPRTFMTQRGEMVLWDPEGWKDEQTGMRLPGGFLVDCFTGFPASSQRDIPDAISDMDRNDEHGYRYCSFCTPAHLQVAPRTVALPQVGSRMPVVGRPRGIGDWAQTRLDRR